EFERFMVRSLGRSEAEAAATLQALCPAVGQVRLTERQLDAMSFDLHLSALRLLLQAEYETSDQLMSFLDTSGDAQVSPGEWASGLSSHLISALNAQELFQRLDVGQMG
ncbi:26S protease regulatory subunit 6A, partial [Durusdinium trenchii]